MCRTQHIHKIHDSHSTTTHTNRRSHCALGSNIASPPSLPPSPPPSTSYSSSLSPLSCLSSCLLSLFVWYRLIVAEMSEQLPPLISHPSLRIITAAAQVGEVSNDVLTFLSASAEYHLLDVINDAAFFRDKSKRSRLTVEDVNASLKLRGAEGSLVLSGGAQTLKDDEVGGAGESKVDLRKVANASLPVCPIETGPGMHWLAVDGQQPLLPQNPIPSTSRGKGKGGKRSRGKQAEAAAGGSGSSDVTAQLSEELSTYLRRCCHAILSQDEAKRARALASLREDPGLQQLLPHLCRFIQLKVPEYLKQHKEPDQLGALLQMLQCLLNNKNFAFLEIYLDRLLPPLMSCLLHIDFERRNVAGGGGGGGGGRGGFGNGGSSQEVTVHSALPPPKWTHWKVRDYAAELLRAICDKHGHTYPTLQARASDMFYTHVARPHTMLTTLYGSITGISYLGRMPVEQTLGPRVDSLAERISRSCLASTLKRDAKGVVEANMCRLALLRAIGLATVASTNSLFVERATNDSGSSVVDGGTTQANNNSAANAAAGAAAAAGGARGGRGSTGSNKGSGRSANPPSRQPAASLRKRLDRSRYSLAKAADKTAAAATTTPPAAAAAASTAGKGETAAAAAGIGCKDGAAVALDGGGGNELDEVIFPWYLLGLSRDGARQGWWLIEKHCEFI
ncbi:unnamed protein product [Pylaiella littoralis]